jgi:hydrogenase maturation factor
MCLSKPQKVLAVKENEILVGFGNSRRVVKSLLSVKKGDYVLCQSNVVVQKVPAHKAREMLEEWKELNKWK